MAKIEYTRNLDGQNRVPPSTLVPGRHLIGQRPLITEDVMLLAAIIVRRYLTSTLFVLVCINPVRRWTAEGNSGLGFHQKQSSID